MTAGRQQQTNDSIKTEMKTDVGASGTSSTVTMMGSLLHPSGSIWDESFVVVKNDAQDTLPSAILNETAFIHAREKKSSDDMKTAMGVKSSATTREAVTLSLQQAIPFERTSIICRAKAQHAIW
jgi:sulfate adenylyltransferase subunit 1 (EFTu-like GTPase family)